MKTETFESTYGLLIRSNEKERSVSETAVYFLLILSMVFAICEAVQIPVTVPTKSNAPAVAQIVERPHSV